MTILRTLRSFPQAADLLVVLDNATCDLCNQEGEEGVTRDILCRCNLKTFATHLTCRLWVHAGKPLRIKEKFIWREEVNKTAG